MLRKLLRGKLAFPSLQLILKLYTLYLDKLVYINKEDPGVPNH